MRPAAYEVISQVGACYGLSLDLIVGRSRAYWLVRARIEIAQRLKQRGYSTTQIGRVMNRDHTTVVYYLGNGKRWAKAGRRWRRPRVKHLCWIKVVAEKAPIRSAAVRAPVQQPQYLVPYAGADMRDYVWRLRQVA